MLKLMPSYRCIIISSIHLDKLNNQVDVIFQNQTVEVVFVSGDPGHYQFVSTLLQPVYKIT